MTDERTRLYLITPPQLEPVKFSEQLKSALGGGDVACLQLRLKDEQYVSLPDDHFRRAMEVIQPICTAHDVQILLNDKVHLVTELGADGVHLGEDDMPITEARSLLGPDYVIGASCYASQHRAMEAGEQGADYVAFGQFYPTATKPPRGIATPDLLSWWREMTVLPSVAIGGITASNAAPLVHAGADFIAVVSAVWNHPAGPSTAVQEFNAVFKELYEGHR